jgi:hypothetical protein
LGNAVWVIRHRLVIVYRELGFDWCYSWRLMSLDKESLAAEIEAPTVADALVCDLLQMAADSVSLSWS